MSSDTEYAATWTFRLNPENAARSLPSRRVHLFANLSLLSDSKRINRVIKRRYISLVIEDRLTWLPAVAEVIAACREVRTILRKLGGKI